MDSDSIGNRGTSDYGWFYAVGRYAERCVFAFAHTAHTAHTARSGTAYPAQRSAGRVGRCWLLPGRLLATGAAVAVTGGTAGGAGVAGVAGTPGALQPKTYRTRAGGTSGGVR